MKISTLIPCYNEEKTIRDCVESCLNQTRKPDQIVVVDDGSTDKSSEILKEFGNKITAVRTPKNTGNKSYAQEYGLKFVTGEILVMTDGDTLLKSNFVELIEKDFEDKNVHAVAGYIISMKCNWLTAVRELDYVIGQDIHKRAQSYINAVLVIPGCGGAFRMKTFKKYISFDHDTLTEDLDFTYKLHKNNFKIKYNKKAIVYTQDPFTIKSYVNQMRRWIGGGWQNLVKHKKVVLSRPGHALEIALMYVEGLVFGTLFFILPAINIFFFARFFLGYIVSATVVGLYGLYRRKRFDLMLYAPIFPFILILNSFIFFEQFIKEVVLRRKNLIWFKPERRAI